MLNFKIAYAAQLVQKIVILTFNVLYEVLLSFNYYRHALYTHSKLNIIINLDKQFEPTANLFTQTALANTSQNRCTLSLHHLPLFQSTTIIVVIKSFDHIDVYTTGVQGLWNFDKFYIIL